ncbi:MAG: RHS repeat-associated core domain-containing protein, partial [Pseudomonadota bacterium]
ISPDPIGYADGPHLYAYVGNNPINFVDPTGLLAQAVRGYGTPTGDFGVVPQSALNHQAMMNIASTEFDAIEFVGSATLVGTVIYGIRDGNLNPADAYRPARLARNLISETSPNLFHRLEATYQTPSDARIVQETGELFGTAPRGSDVPTVQAFAGPLPAGARGIEFTTSAQGTTNFLSGQVRWRPGDRGVELREDVTLNDGRTSDVAVIQCFVTKNTQC